MNNDNRVVPEWEPGLVTHSPAGNIILHGGSGTGYRSYGCRCRACTEANRHRADQDRKKRVSKDLPDTVPHGKATTYINWGCRCAPCTEAQTFQCNGYYSRVLSAEARYKAEMEAYDAGRRQGPKPVLKRRDNRDTQKLLQEFVETHNRLPRRRSKDQDERRIFYRFKVARESKKDWAIELWSRFH